MAISTALFVSKRLQRLSAALFCLMAAQMVLASCTPEPTLGLYGGAARVAVSR
jgi:hypothetical protein